MRRDLGYRDQRDADVQRGICPDCGISVGAVERRNGRTLGCPGCFPSTCTRCGDDDAVLTEHGVLCQLHHTMAVGGHKVSHALIVQRPLDEEERRSRWSAEEWGTAWTLHWWDGEPTGMLFDYLHEWTERAVTLHEALGLVRQALLHGWAIEYRQRT